MQSCATAAYLARNFSDVLCFPSFRLSKGFSLALIAKQEVNVWHGLCKSLLERGNLEQRGHAKSSRQNCVQQVTQELYSG